VNYRQLMEIYQKVIGAAKGRADDA
jgi:hypothetical protein